jgi:hypothetical protein
VKKIKILILMAIPLLFLVGCNAPAGASEVADYNGSGTVYTATVLAGDDEMDCIAIKGPGMASIECLWDKRRPATDAVKDPNRKIDLEYHVIKVNETTETECVVMHPQASYGSMDCNS